MRKEWWIEGTEKNDFSLDLLSQLGKVTPKSIKLGNPVWKRTERNRTEIRVIFFFSI